eukprot:TRINITY_DN4373_c0_g1_i5.p1 TRINITY_DN4373_c0_g1~~TRINITY_DN4373_c0_g1_i5.p1  ORF type:complete len:818 (-),score=195.56 TRINITY_DN4373_c0_g1_i5:51-2441(-)
MYLDAGQWDEAHRVATQHLPEAEVAALYEQQAQVMEQQGKFNEAERLYLAVNEPLLAINMYKKNRQFDRMINLVAKYRKETLNETYLHLARQLEHENNFKQAEQYYLQSKDWKSAVTMYRENDMWDDALRIAKAQGGTHAHKQVSYAAAVTMPGDSGIKFLAKKGLADLAVEYAIERGEYPEAFRIAEAVCREKLPEIHLQYAMSLEDTGQFDKAEDEFVKAGKPKEAVDMYVHQRDWANALRVAQSHESTATDDVYTSWARVEQDELKDYKSAETHYLMAKKPEHAINMYKDLRMWEDALRVAKNHSPHLVLDLQNEHAQFVSSQVSPNDGADYIINQAKLLLKNSRYSEAIDAYLRIGRHHSNDIDFLARTWDNAVNLAYDNCTNRIPEVVTTVGRKLVEVGRYDHAADLFLSIQGHKDAIDAYCQGGMFPKARALAESSAPHLLDMVEQAYQNHLIRNDRLDDLHSLNPEAAMDLFASRGEWNKVYELASQRGDILVLQRYASMHASKLVQSEKYIQALEIFIKYGAPSVPANFPIYRRLATEILSQAHIHDEKSDGHVELREVLFKLVTELRETDAAPDILKEFERFLLITHYCSMASTCKRAALQEQAARVAISLLRYTTDIPADKAFYEAGTLCRELNWTGMAFVFFNRFVDLTDFIDSPDTEIENTDFLGSDIPAPTEIPIPTQQSFSVEEREQVREWVLQEAISNSSQSSLATRACEKCNRQIYEAALTCANCRTDYQPCVVTGYPINRQKKVQCKSCKMPANKDDWNSFVVKMKTCPWCGGLQTPFY